MVVGRDGGDGDGALIERILTKRRPKLCTLMDDIPPSAVQEDEYVSHLTERRDAERKKKEW